MDATWPAAAARRAGPWLLRDGAGGGKRVSAATALAPVDAAAIDAAEAAMQAAGQVPLFQIRDARDAGLDALLAARGYRVVDPVALYLAAAADLAGPLPHLSVIPSWPPLAIAREFWAEAGLGPARLAVMDRAPQPKTVLLARHNDRPAGVTFVAIAGRVAMLHALEVPARLRRQGIADKILRAAANWALDNGAIWLALAVTEANAPARALYSSRNMQIVGHYHYRTREAAKAEQ
jgi:GNAT superfamily N-acetyltransferase